MRKELIVLFVFIMLLFSGCDFITNLFNNNNKPNNPLPPDNPKRYRVGEEGLSVSVEDEITPTEVYEGSEFQIILNLENKGAYNIEEGVLSLSVEKNYLDLSGWELPDTAIKIDDLGKIKVRLMGKSIEYPLGEREILLANIKAKRVGNQLEQDKTKFSVISCYNYRSYADIDVCVDTTNVLSKMGKSCEVENIGVGGGQGAPLVVTLVEVETYMKDAKTAIPSFKIYLENKGSGDIINKEYTEYVCGVGDGPKENYNLFNRVYITAKLNGKELNCKSKGKNYVEMENNEGEITCNLDEGVSKGSVYKTPLNIVLDYGYSDTLSQEIIIKK